MTNMIAVAGKYCPFCKQDGGLFHYEAGFIEGKGEFWLCENCNTNFAQEEFNDAIIANFLGFTYHKNKHNRVWMKAGMIMHHPPEFKNSFEWLMEAVIKLEESDLGFRLCRKRVEVYIDTTKEVLFSIKLGSRLESLYAAVVKYLTEYYQPPTKINEC